MPQGQSSSASATVPVVCHCDCDCPHGLTRRAGRYECRRRTMRSDTTMEMTARKTTSSQEGDRQQQQRPQQRSTVPSVSQPVSTAETDSVDARAKKR